jgi:voltage-gated potassium channel
VAAAPMAAAQPSGVAERRPVIRGLVRSGVTTALVLVLYYLAPVDERTTGRTLLFLIGGLVLIGLVIAWQVRAILRARHPALRAVEALALSLPLFLVMFAVVHLRVAAGDPDAFSEPLTRTDALYFVVTVFATVGFGDIAPVSQAARALTTVQMVADLVLIGLVLRVFLAAVEHRRRAAQVETPPAVAP